MTTARSRKADAPAERATSSLDDIQVILASGADVTIVLGKGAEKVRIPSLGPVYVGKIGRFGFLEYRPLEYRPEGEDVSSSRIRVFISDKDTGIERVSLPAALIEAASHGCLLPEERPALAEAACRVLLVVNK